MKHFNETIGLQEETLYIKNAIDKENTSEVYGLVVENLGRATYYIKYNVSKANVLVYCL